MWQAQSYTTKTQVPCESWHRQATFKIQTSLARWHPLLISPERPTQASLGYIVKSHFEKAKGKERSRV